MVTELTPRTSVPVTLRKVVLSKNYPFAQIPREDFYFQGYPHFPNLFVIIDWDRLMNQGLIHRTYREFTIPLQIPPKFISPMHQVDIDQPLYKSIP
jgi:hypothetical protein